MAVFNMTQNAAETWLGSNNEVRRELRDILCLNRTLNDASLSLEMRKPFDALLKQPAFVKNTSNWRSFEPLISDFVGVFIGPIPEYLQAEMKVA